MASNIDCVIFLGGGELVFYDKDGLIEEHKLPGETVIGDEIRNESFISSKVTDFFDKLARRNLKIALFFDNGAVFEKYLDIDPTKSNKAMTEGFIDELPLVKENSRIIAKRDKDRLRVMVMDWKPIGKIGGMLSSFGEIKYVGNNDAFVDQNLTNKDVFSLVANKSNINWVKRGVGFDQMGMGGKRNDQVIKKLLIMVSVSLSVAVAVFAVYYGYTKLFANRGNKKEVTSSIEQSVTPTPTLTVTPSINYLKFEEMKVKILNGSGVQGQAKQVTKLLSPLGITKFTTGNATESSGVVKLYFGERIKEDDRRQIKKILEDEFDDVSVKDSPHDGNDILIITGQ